jgi:small subunit ribosomal protein S6
MALYEHVVVTRPDISPQQVEALIEDITRVITERNGKVGKSEYWGLRNLAYPIKKSRKAHYSLLNIDAPGDAIHEVERRHRINEDVLRFLTVRVDAHSDDASPVIARKDRDERRKPRRDEFEIPRDFDANRPPRAPRER